MPLTKRHSYLTGFFVDPSGNDGTCGQTFRINDGNALVSNLSFPIYSDSTTTKFQVGVAAWNGAEASGPLLYLSPALTALGGNWQTFNVATSNLFLNQGQEYVLFFTCNSFVNAGVANSAGVGYVPADAYTDGQYFNVSGNGLGISDLFTNGWGGSPANLAFQVSYQVVPEPTLTALVALSCLPWLRRRPIRSMRR